MMKKIPLKLFNTETRQKEEIKAKEGRLLRMYTCGPTVYNYAHIGNFRTYVFEDLLRRTLKFFGFDVIQVMNLTDIDDKTIKGALLQGISLDEFTAPFKKAFFEDLKTLHIEPVEYYPAATDYIQEMIQIIERLVEKKVAYVGSDKSVYFAIRSFPSYGRLSHLELNELKIGASERVAADEYDKENASDFVLWKAYDPIRDGNIFWESPFGLGRPGWHIECSAMAMGLLGQSIDIHVGGVDNLFPHHENEIAQSESYSCCQFVRYWLHAEHLLVDHKKMSKSLGNFYTLRDLQAQGYEGKEIRYLLLQTHYRTQLNFTFTGLEASRSSLQRLFDLIARLKSIRQQKMHKALDLILEKALPVSPEKKQIQERLLSDLQQEKDRDILDSSFVEPILQRCFSKEPDQFSLLKQILKEIKEEKVRTELYPILKRALLDRTQTEQLLSCLIHTVRDEKDRDLLDPQVMKPLLQKMFSLPSNQVVNAVLRDLKVKKNHGFTLPLLSETLEMFMTHLADDLNISAALASVFDLVREINRLCDQEEMGISEAEDVIDFFKKIDQVLGIGFFEEEQEQIPLVLIEALQQRELARKEKNWKEADECRLFIQSHGYLIEDTPQGARLKKK